MINYGNNKCHRIEEIDFSQNPTSTFFWNKTGTHISYVDYYRQQYSKNINNTRQPLIRSRIKFRTEEMDIFLIPELLVLTGLDDEMRADFRCMQDIANYTRLRPNERQAKCQKLVDDLSSGTAKAKQAAFNVDIDQHPSTVNAVRFPHETIVFGRGDQQTLDDRSSFNIRGDIFFANRISRWALLHSPNDNQAAVGLAKQIIHNANQCGINIDQPQVDTFAFRNNQDLCDKIKKYAQSA